jgi:hypothetical protein
MCPMTHHRPVCVLNNTLFRQTRVSALTINGATHGCIHCYEVMHLEHRYYQPPHSILQVRQRVLLLCSCCCYCFCYCTYFLLMALPSDGMVMAPLWLLPFLIPAYGTVMITHTPISSATATPTSAPTLAPSPTESAAITILRGCWHCSFCKVPFLLLSLLYSYFYFYSYSYSYTTYSFSSSCSCS